MIWKLAWGFSFVSTFFIAQHIVRGLWYSQRDFCADINTTAGDVCLICRFFCVITCSLPSIYEVYQLQVRIRRSSTSIFLRSFNVLSLGVCLCVYLDALSLRMNQTKQNDQYESLIIGCKLFKNSFCHAIQLVILLIWCSHSNIF